MLKFLKELFFDELGTTLSVTYSFSPNTLIQSSQVNQNFTDVQSVVNALTADNYADDSVTAAKLNADVVRANYGLIQHTDGSLYVDVSDTTPCLEVNADGGLRVVVDDTTIELTASGLQCKSDKVMFLDTDQTVTGTKTFEGTQAFTNIDVEGTAEVDAITLNGNATDAASGICTLDSSSIVKGKRRGSWTTISNDTVYQAAKDGIACAVVNDNDWDFVGYTDSNPSPSTARTGCGSGYYNWLGISFPVKKGDYYKIVGTKHSGTATANYFFIPEGD